MTTRRAGRRPTRVLLIGMGDVADAGLRSVLSGHEDVEVLGPPSSSADVANADIHVIDVADALTRGETVARTLMARRPGLVVLAVAADGRPDLARHVLSQGAHGVLSLGWSAEDILATIRAASRDVFVRPDPLTHTWAGDGVGAGLDERHRGALTPRELQVLHLIAAGLSNDEIGHRLYVSTNTVKTYIRSAYRRIDVRSRSQAMRWCFEHGLVRLPPSSITSESEADASNAWSSERQLG